MLIVKVSLSPVNVAASFHRQLLLVNVSQILLIVKYVFPFINALFYEQSIFLNGKSILEFFVVPKSIVCIRTRTIRFHHLHDILSHFPSSTTVNPRFQMIVLDWMFHFHLTSIGTYPLFFLLLLTILLPVTDTVNTKDFLKS